MYQIQCTGGPITLRRDVALRRAHITTRNVTRARQILERALTRLQERGFVREFSPIPSSADRSFQVLLETRDLRRLAEMAPSRQRDHVRRRRREVAVEPEGGLWAELAPAPASEAASEAAPESTPSTTSAAVEDVAPPAGSTSHSYYGAVRMASQLYYAPVLRDKLHALMVSPPPDDGGDPHGRSDGLEHQGALDTQLKAGRLVALWRADLLDDGDVLLRLVLRVSPGIAPQTQVRLAAQVRTALDRLSADLVAEGWPDVDDVMIEVARDAGAHDPNDASAAH